MRGDTLVFTRPLGIKRNAVVLPKGYELISCNFPSQVLQQDDGRVAISFWNSTPSEAALTLRAKPVRNLPAGKSSMASRLGERAYQDVTPQSEIVVFRFAAVKTGESIRLRMFETYTDAERYKLVGDELSVWRHFPLRCAKVRRRSPHKQSPTRTRGTSCSRRGRPSFGSSTR